MGYSKHENIASGHKWNVGVAKDMDDAIYAHDTAISEKRKQRINDAWSLAKVGGRASRMNTYTETKPTDKVYIWLCQDDGLKADALNLAMKYSLPICSACIPYTLEDSAQLQRYNTAVANGGELLAHTGKWIVDYDYVWKANYDSDTNRQAYNTAKGLSLDAEGYANLCIDTIRSNYGYFTNSKEDMYALFVETKEIIESYGFVVNGAMRAGSSASVINHVGTSIPIIGTNNAGSIENGVVDDYVRTFYEFSDEYGMDAKNEHSHTNGKEPFRHQRSYYENMTADAVLGYIDSAYDDRANGIGLKCLYFHGLKSEDNIATAMTPTKLEAILTGLRQRVNAGKVVVCKPSDYYKQFSKWTY